MSNHALPKWRLLMSGGALAALAAVGLGAVNAQSVSTTDRATDEAITEHVGQPQNAGQAAGDRGLIRPRALGRALVHGTVTLDLPRKGLVTVQLDHGKLESIAANAITISEAGNTSVTVTTDDKTKVRKNGEKAKLSDLKAGDEVFVVSELEGDTATAYRIVVPRTAP